MYPPGRKNAGPLKAALSAMAPGGRDDRLIVTKVSLKRYLDAIRTRQNIVAGLTTFGEPPEGPGAHQWSTRIIPGLGLTIPTVCMKPMLE